MSEGQRFAAVLVDAGGPAARRPFDYLIPDQLRGEIRAGSLVVVPFGARMLRGIVVALLESSPVPAGQLKPIRQLYRAAVYQDRLAPQLAAWVAERYACSLVEAYRAVLPPAIGGRPTRTWTMGDAEPPEPGHLPTPLEDVYGLLRASGSITVGQVAATLDLATPEALQRISRLVKLGLLMPEALQPSPPVSCGPALYAVATADLEAALARLSRSPRQRELLLWLAEHGRPAAISEAPGSPSGVRAAFNALIERGLVQPAGFAAPAAPGPLAPASLGGPASPLALTAAQQDAVEPILADIAAHRTGQYLLLGVTGSGKTEVYLQVIAAALARGRQALVLVPEIGLTPQALARFESRFPGQVAVLHSRLAAGQRTRAWRELSEGKVSIAIGPRSAVFAPLPDLGVIVVDEEHEGSYKQEDIPRYDAREAARARAALAGVPVILGSATPALESYAAASGHHLSSTSAGVNRSRAPDEGLRLLSLPERIDGRRLPRVDLVDMRAELRQGNRSIFSRQLSAELASCLGRGEQAILFLNRRGLATFVLCRECGYVVRCGSCDVSLVYHGHENTLRCHYCGHSERPPAECPKCHGAKIRYFGTGTQRVEAYVRELLPEARVARLDADVAMRRGLAETTLDSFARREIDVLVGTQIIGKGLDLPGVTLVGVVAADTSLGLPDFRAAERTFGLVTQVAGRAGRGELAGLVVVQSYNPEHYSLRHAVAHDYAGFASEELGYRRELSYPPYSHLCLVRISGEHQGAVESAAKAAGVRARQCSAQRGGRPEVLGPSPAPLYRLQGRYRWNIVLKDIEPLFLAHHATELLDALDRETPPAIRVGVDMDPQAVL